MKKILVTAIGSMSAECVIRSLKSQKFEVYGADIYPQKWHPIAKFCHNFFQVPKASDSSFLEVLLTIIKQNDINYVLPLTDPEVDILSSHRYCIEEMNAKLLLASDSTVTRCRDKAFFSELFSESSSFFCIPSFVNPLECLENFSNTKQFVAKRRRGRSSEGIAFICKEQMLNSNFSMDYVFQPFIEGEIFTVDFARDGEGNIKVCPRKELLRTKNGAGTVVEIVDATVFMTSIKEIAEKLDILGCMNVEFIQDKFSNLFLMDINPRFSAGIGFSYLAGFDFVKFHIESFFQHGFSLQNSKDDSVGKVFVKRFCDFA